VSERTLFSICLGKGVQINAKREIVSLLSSREVSAIDRLKSVVGTILLEGSAALGGDRDQENSLVSIRVGKVESDSIKVGANQLNTSLLSTQSQAKIKNQQTTST
jgi:hypothetical protein